MPLQPLEIEVVRAKELRIQWAEGDPTVIPLVELRRACPCATCRDLRDKRARAPAALPLVDSPAQQQTQAQARRAELVGQYALRIVWQDGHDTGIYDYELLHRLGRTLADGNRARNPSAE